MLEHQKVSQIEVVIMEIQVDPFMFWSMEGNGMVEKYVIQNSKIVKGTPKLELLVEQNLPLILISLTSTSELVKKISTNGLRK